MFRELWALKPVQAFTTKPVRCRDMVQNHLLQLLCLVAMESPHKLNANSIRNEKLKVLEALRPLIGAAT